MPILDMFKRKAVEKKSELGTLTVSDLTTFLGSRVVGANNMQVYNPSGLVGQKGLTIFNRMRKDDQVKAALTFKKNTTIATGYSIDSPEGRPDDWEPTEFVRQVLDNLEGTFSSRLLEIMSALDFGYSITEKVWAQDGSYLYYEALRTRAPHYFRFVADDVGNLLGVTQDYAKVKSTLPKSKFIIYSFNKEFDNWYGESDLEAAYRPWWAKENAYLWLSMFLERFGVPPVFLMYNPGPLNSAQITDLKSLVQNIQSATMGLLPRAKPDDMQMWSPEFSDNAGRTFIPSIDMYNKDIARAILMPGLLGMTPDDQAGSYARSSVIFDVFMLVVDRLREQMEDDIVNQQIIKPLIDFNFNLSPDEYPRFKLNPLTDKTTKEVFDTWKQLIDGKVVTPQKVDEEHIREALEFPTLTDEYVGDREPEPEPELEVEPEPQLFAQVNPERIKKRLDAIEEMAIERMRAQLLEAQEIVLNAVSKGREVSAIKNTAKIKAALTEMLTQAFKAGYETMFTEAGKTRNFGLMGPKAAMAWLNKKRLVVAGVIDSELTNKVKMTLLNALKNGESGIETQSKIRMIFEPFIGNPDVIRDDDVINPYRLENIVRTNTTEAYNQGRLSAIRDPDVAAIIKGVRYSAVMDERTTDVCEFLNGRVFRLDDPDLDRLAPPNHFMCRSVLTPVTLTQELREEEFLTVADIGKARELAGEGFT